MSRTFSREIGLGQPAPNFDLLVANPEAAPGDGERVRLDDYAGARALVVVFTCNHCPYAQHVESTLIDLAHAYGSQGVAFVAISSNDPTRYPDDSFDAMADRAREMQYPFAYLFDDSQEVARAYGAVCTPDPYVFDQERRLVYHGRFDETRPGMGVATGEELRHALDELLRHGRPVPNQFPSMGCNIKWKPGREPEIAAGPVPEEYRA